MADEWRLGHQRSPESLSIPGLKGKQGKELPGPDHLTSCMADCHRGHVSGNCEAVSPGPARRVMWSQKFAWGLAKGGQNPSLVISYVTKSPWNSVFPSVKWAGVLQLTCNVPYDWFCFPHCYGSSHCLSLQVADPTEATSRPAVLSRGFPSMAEWGSELIATRGCCFCILTLVWDHSLRTS